MIGRPRPKKAKVQLVAESGLTESTGITGTTQSDVARTNTPLLRT